MFDRNEELLFLIYQELRKFVESGGANQTYDLTSPTNVTVGALSAGTNITGLTWQQIVQAMTNTYLAPAFTSFNITGLNSTIEVGTIVDNLRTFTWATSNSTNVSPNTISIIDFTNSVVLGSGLANDGAESLNVGSVQKIVKVINRWTIQGTNTQSATFSRNLDISWDFLKFYGLTNPTTSAQVRANSSTFNTTFSIVIPQGTTTIYFAYENDRGVLQDSSVKYVEGFNANVGNTFIESSIVIDLPNGVTKTYRLYKTTLPVPYGANATYNVTLPN